MSLSEVGGHSLMVCLLRAQTVKGPKGPKRSLIESKNTANEIIFAGVSRFVKIIMGFRGFKLFQNC